MRRKLIAGNYKMNGNRAKLRALVESAVATAERAEAEVAIFPNFVHLALALELASGSQLKVGAQNVSEHNPGAYTGETSAEMLVDLSLSAVLVGHSERRQYFAESSDLVAQKARRALSCGLIPYVCLGESLAEREAGRTHQVLHAQLAPVLALGAELCRNLVFAYEPVWAIGTGKVATPEQAQDAHAFIRSQLAHCDDKLAGFARILYGGSVKSSNAKSLFELPDVDGALVGGASLDGLEFAAIVHAAQLA
jgi:triosephosphate isomerase